MIRLQLVEIDATGDAFADSVSAIPMGGATPTRIIAFMLVSEIQLADNGPPRVIDSECHRTRICQVIRYPGLWIERIRIVRK